MPANWLWVIGGILIAILAITVVARLLNQVATVSQRQDMINRFNELHSIMESVCLQEVGNSRKTKFSVYDFVRVVYVSGTNEVVDKVMEKVKRKEMGSGDKLCLQFKDEDTPRCVELSCKATMPYMGALPEYIDIKLFVKRLLGEPLVKDYTLSIEKVGGKEIEVVVE